ncbi:DUF4974 domain-containing protein [Mariniphaga sediminis]|uniref:DUF4974 domain-containing protein n=1 Tax=Mariniphaga sediminis TaxID=1628158 RepID=A0A399CTQ7_9BACT|nr:FecR domain-containing protein [Mariniphaga sediminis]RIH63284.1 DUF4974 domain-containing protein [Mariniphaga sediminis]
MNENKKYIDILIGKSISGNATSDEIKELREWVASAENNHLLFERSKKVWDKGDRFIPADAIQQDKSRLGMEYNRYLSEKVKRIRRQSFIYKMAAILAFPVALAIGLYFFGAPGNFGSVSEQVCEVISPKGHVAKCILPDGTEVWVNTGSSITYDASGFNQNNREVRLEGEAYFEVTSNKKKPFKVITPHADVRVTGTAFNVVAYPGNGIFEAVLAEGSVQLQLKSGNRKDLEMNPGQRVIFNTTNQDLAIQEVDANIYTSWRNGELLFKDATLNDLINELERIYDIQFHLTPENLGEFRFRGMFSYNNNLIEALEKIKRTSGIRYYIENKEVWLRESN